MSCLQIIDTILISEPKESRYNSLKEFLEGIELKELAKELGYSYLQKKIDSIEDLMLLSLLYKTFMDLQKNEKDFYFSINQEKSLLRSKIKDRLFYFHSQKKLKSLCFCDIFQETNKISELKTIRENIKILFSDLFEPLVNLETPGLGFLGKIFFFWCLILEPTFESEELLLSINMMSLAINPRLYQQYSFSWTVDYRKIWTIFKNLMNITGLQNQLENFNPHLNCQLFFEVFPENSIRSFFRDCDDEIKNYAKKNLENLIRSWKTIFSIAFTKKTLLFFTEMSKIVKKNCEADVLFSIYKEIVLPRLLDELKGKFFFAVLDILKIYLFGFFIEKNH